MKKPMKANNTSTHSGGVLLCLAFFLLPFVAAAATNDLSSALQTGLFEEEANRNLPAAMEAYEKVAKQFDQNRALAATAIFRLGEVNRKLGKTNEAAAFYQRILREFTDQDTLAKLSQQNLAGMGMANEGENGVAETGASSRGFEYVIQSGDSLARIAASYRAAGVNVTLETILKANPGLNATRLRVGQKIFIPDPTGANPASASKTDIAASIGALNAAEAETALLEAQVKQLETAKKGEELLQIVLQNYSNPVLTKLFQDLATAEQQLVVVSKDFGPESANYINAQSLINKIKSQINEATDGVLIGLRAKRDAAVATAKAWRERIGQSSTTQSNKSGDSAPITALLDEEETEIRRIQAMIQNSPDLINAPATDGLTPLYRAATAGQLRVTRFLLDNGADINLRTVLYGAADKGHRAMVEFLLSRGADVNGYGSNGNTALHQAAMRGFRSVAEVLLANKANVNARMQNQGQSSTPLHLTVEGGHAEMVSFLLAKGAEVDALDASGQTPLIKAAIKGHSEVLGRLLAAKAKTDVEDNQGRTALSHAAERGHAETVKVLLEAKANPNEGKVNLPLHCAIKSQSAGIVEALLKAGADANRVAKVTWSVRFGSSDYGSPELSPLALAVSYGQLDVVKLLLAHKANPNVKRADGSPLIFSALQNAEMTKALLDAGAKPNVEDGPNSHRTPLTGTFEPKVIGHLLAAGADPEVNSPLINAVANNYLQAAEALLKGGANPNAVLWSDKTALHYATEKKNPEMIALLLSHKADVNARDRQGRTPLDYAEGKGQSTGAVPGSPGGIPLTYQWTTGQGDAKSEPERISELLRQHGGRADLPKLDRIELVRPGSFQNAIFIKGNNDWNRFTLMEVILNNYRRPAQRSLGGGATFPDRLAALTNPSSTSPPFPDLRRIVVIRQQPANSSRPAERITVDLLNATNGVDCAKDITLNFGDVVEIPERLHTLQEPAVGLTSAEMAQVWACRIGVVTLIYQGKKTSLQVAGTPAEALICSILAGEEARKALFSSADLARVKVTRRDSADGKPREWIVDCSGANNAPDLWLRDGDVIEVPEK